MKADGTPSPFWYRVEVALLLAPLLYLVALRLFVHLTVFPTGDEAYYWMWGQRPGLSYFDHPPLQAWLMACVAPLFGWHPFSVRLLTWFSLGATFWIFWLWSARLAPGDRLRWFLATSLAYVTIPVIGLMTLISFQDHLLLLFAIATFYFFHGFTEDFRAGQPDWRRLYLAALCLGLAFLSKYNAIFIALGLGVWVIASPALRPLLRRRQLWLALLIVIAMQAPVIIWNLTEGLASFRFHLSDRPSWDLANPQLGRSIGFLRGILIGLGPALLLGLLRLPFVWKRLSPAHRRAGQAGLAIFATSTLFWAALSPALNIFHYWNIIAYAALAPIALVALGRRFGLALHVIVGLASVTLLGLNYAVYPRGLYGVRDSNALPNYGWPDVAARVASLAASHPGTFLAGTHFTLASQLGFALKTTNVTEINPAPTQYDFWWQPAGHLGQNAIIVSDRNYPIGLAAPWFASVEKLETVDVTGPLGHKAWSYDLYLGHDYRTPPP